MIKKVAGFGMIAFWLGLTCIRLAVFSHDDIPEYEPIKEYDIVRATVIEAVMEKEIEQHHEETVEFLEMILESEYSTEEQKLMARLGMSEAGVLEVEAIQAVVQVAMNRKNSDDYPDTIEGVIYQKINGHPQFSTRDNGDPNEKCYTAVANAIASPEAFPTDMYWFNSEHYPNYGYPYTIIDGMYFSTETDYSTVEVEE